MQEPQKHLLVLAFVAAKIREEKSHAARLSSGRAHDGKGGKSKKEVASPSFYDLEARWGTNRQNLMKLYHGRTVGMDVMLRIADARFFGSFDAMVNAARHWWGALTPRDRKEVDRWCAEQNDLRRGPSRHPPSAEDRAEIARIDEGTRPSARHAVAASEPPSGSFRHRR
jgi:hypothetical protein